MTTYELLDNLLKTLQRRRKNGDVELCDEMVRTGLVNILQMMRAMLFEYDMESLYHFVNSVVGVILSLSTEFFDGRKGSLLEETSEEENQIFQLSEEALADHLQEVANYQNNFLLFYRDICLSQSEGKVPFEFALGLSHIMKNFADIGLAFECYLCHYADKQFCSTRIFNVSSFYLSIIPSDRWGILEDMERSYVLGKESYLRGCVKRGNDAIGSENNLPVPPPSPTIPPPSAMEEAFGL